MPLINGVISNNSFSNLYNNRLADINYYFGSGKILKADSTDSTAVIPCKSNTNYLVYLFVDTYTRIGYLEEEPTAGVTVQDVYIFNDNQRANEIHKFLTSSNAKYIVIFYYEDGNSNNTKTKLELQNSTYIFESN